MTVNLKQLKFQCNTLDMVISDMERKPGMPIIRNDLKAIYELLTSIEHELHSMGESKIDLDMPREEAINHAYGN
jgi:hypothetical protein